MLDMQDYEYSIRCAEDPAHRQLLGNATTGREFLNRAVAKGWTQVTGPDYHTAEGWELDELVSFACPAHSREVESG